MHAVRSSLAVSRRAAGVSSRLASSARSQQHTKAGRNSLNLGLGCLAIAAGAAASTVAMSSAEMEKCDAIDKIVVSTVADLTVHDKFEPLRPKNKNFVRIDEAILAQASEFVTNHALHANLRGDSLVETFEVYLNPTTSEIHVVAHFGCGLNGHPSVVHGGILALAFDETFGWLLHFGLKTNQAFTANLNVNYRNKTSEDSTVAIKGRLVEKNGRKLLTSATMVDEKDTILAEATALFITARAKE